MICSSFSFHMSDMCYFFPPPLPSHPLLFPCVWVICSVLMIRHAHLLQGAEHVSLHREVNSPLLR